MLAEWLDACTSKSVVRRAVFSGLVVGTLLVAINHGDALLNGEIDAMRLFRIALTMIVPYVVSTVSSVSTMIGMRHGDLG